MLELKLEAVETPGARCLLCEAQPDMPLVLRLRVDDCEAGICLECVRAGAGVVETRLGVTRALLATRLAITEALVEAIQAGEVEFPEVLDVVRVESHVEGARLVRDGKARLAVVKAKRLQQGTDTVVDK